MGHRPLALEPILLLSSLGLGCSTSETTDDQNVLETAVLVDPAEFLGAFPCGDIDGAPKSYIATVTDLNTDPPREIGRSPRLGCSIPVAFTNVVVGNHYSASIEVFEATPEQAALAAWPKVICGAEEQSGAALAQSLQQITIRGCDQLTGAGLSDTAIVVDPREALGSLVCADDEQDGVTEIKVIPIAPEDAGLPTVTVSCKGGAVTFADDVEPGVSYAFRLEAEGLPVGTSWGSSCSATAFEGLGIRATCSKLAQGGTVTIPLLALLEEAELSCGQGVTRAKIALYDDLVLVSQATVGCASDVTFSGVSAGTFVATVELFDGATSIALRNCATSLAAGESATLACFEEN